MFEVKTLTNRTECETLKDALQVAKEELNMRYCTSIIINKEGEEK